LITTIFITGTDTGVGKTRIARAVLNRLLDQGYSAAGFKPVASGAERTAEGLRNDDALVLRAASSPGLEYEEVNPWCFEPAIAPHLAAREAGVWRCATSGWWWKARAAGWCRSMRSTASPTGSAARAGR